MAYNRVTIHGLSVHVYTGLNARDAYPMYADIGDEAVAMFTNKGTLSKDFIAAMRTMCSCDNEVCKYPLCHANKERR